MSRKKQKENTSVEKEEIQDTELENEEPERIDKVMNVMIAVGATLILMFTTFGILKVNSAIKSATILNRTTAAAVKNEEKSTSQEESASQKESEKQTTYHTTPPYTPQTELASEEETETESETAEPSNPEADKNKSAAQMRINMAALTPAATGFSPLDQKAGEIISGISGTPYDKLSRIYSYVIYNISTGNAATDIAALSSTLGDVAYVSEGDSLLVYEAYTGLASKMANSSQYASMFVVLARAAGFDAYRVTGTSHKTGGNHAWAIVKIGGYEYIFDPYLEDLNKENGTIRYHYFCRTQKELAGNYKYADKQGDIAAFGGFRVMAPMTLNVNFGEIAGACRWVSSKDNAPCEEGTKTYIDMESGETIKILGNVPGISVSEWKLTLVQADTGEETVLSVEKGKEKGYSYTWKPENAGNYRLILSAKDNLGRICRVSAEIRITGDQPLSGLNVVQKKIEGEKETYLIEARGEEGIGDIEYSFSVYFKNKEGDYELVDKSWITWNSSSSIVISIPEETPEYSDIKVKIIAVDEANNKAQQEITIITKSKKDR